MSKAAATPPSTKPAPGAPQPATEDTKTSQRWVLVGILLFLALCLRLFHITDPPLDFHGQRQYWDANRARAMYYAGDDFIDPQLKELAKLNSQAPTEPPVLETLAVAAYRMTGGENLAWPRAFSAIFWIIGGWFLFLLASRLFSPGVALIPLVFYLFTPFGVIASRTFQPDPLMSMLTVASLYATYRYFTEFSIKRLAWAAVAAGLAVFVKPMALFFVLPVFLAPALTQGFPQSGDRRQNGWRALFHPHMLLFGLALLIGLGWVLHGLFDPTLSVQSQAGKTFLPALLAQWEHWYRWLVMLADSVVGAPWLILGIVGVLLCRERLTKALLAGGWIGYVIFGLFFNYHVTTHSYYSLPLLAIVALSLGVLAMMIAPRVAELSSKAALIAAAAVMLLGMLFYTGVRQIHPEYAPQVRIMEEIGEAVGHNPHCIFLTRDYGDPLRYHGQLSGLNWPAQADLQHARRLGRPTPTAEERLRSYMEQNQSEFFIVTEGGEFMQQQDLSKLLTTRYPMVVGKPEFAIFDLRNPKSTGPRPE
ncbi:MAG: ArnT family glycosyltransferase [Armatimonadota bacterium]